MPELCEASWSCWEDELLDDSDKENVDPAGLSASSGMEAMGGTQPSTAAILNHQSSGSCSVATVKKLVKRRLEGKKPTTKAKKTLVFPKRSAKKRIPLADITHHFVGVFEASQLQPVAVTLPV